jgi:hypothetical protein
MPRYAGQQFIKKGDEFPYFTSGHVLGSKFMIQYVTEHMNVTNEVQTLENIF